MTAINVPHRFIKLTDLPCQNQKQWSFRVRLSEVVVGRLLLPPHCRKSKSDRLRMSQHSTLVSPNLSSAGMAWLAGHSQSLRSIYKFLGELFHAQSVFNQSLDSNVFPRALSPQSHASCCFWLVADSLVMDGAGGELTLVSLSV